MCRRPEPSDEVKARLRAQYLERNRRLGRRTHECYSCTYGIHDVYYTDAGVAMCRCCERDMTDEGFPKLEVQ